MQIDLLKLEWLNSFEGVEITKIGLKSKSKVLLLYVTISASFNPTSLIKMEAKLFEEIKSLNSVRIIVNRLESISTIENFDQYKETLILSIKRDLAINTEILYSCKIVLEKNTIIFKISNPIAAAFFTKKETLDYINQRVEDIIGPNFKIKIDVKEKHVELLDEQYFEHKNIEERNLLKDINVAVANLTKDTNKAKKKNEGDVLFGKHFRDEILSIEGIREEHGKIAIQGKIFNIDFRSIKGDKTILSFDISDDTSSLTCKAFLDSKKAHELKNKIIDDVTLAVRGELRYDKFARETILTISDLVEVVIAKRDDLVEKKRVELHLHSNMSALDAVTPVKQFIKRAAKWNHSAIAITDHAGIQSFPDAYEASMKYGIKVLYGVEANLINDSKPMVVNSNNDTIDQPYIVLDIETTGLNPKKDKIIEVAAVKIINDEIRDIFHSMIDPEIEIPQEITKLTGITNEMVQGSPKINDVMEQFYNFVENTCLVAHNASFDLSFLREALGKTGLIISNAIIDTLSLSRELLKDTKKHNLAALAAYFHISSDRHHRALDDTKATANIFIKLKEMLKKQGVKNLSDMNSVFAQISNLNNVEVNHVVLLVQNQIGLHNLYKLISTSHIDYFYRKPRIPKSILMKNREGIIVGSACNSGEVYKSILNGVSNEELKTVASFYDYLEIQPLSNNEHLIAQKKVGDLNDLKRINLQIVDLADLLDKPVVATGDVHYLDPTDAIFRNILLSGQKMNISGENNNLYFKTTEEMLKEFDYLPPEKAYQAVIENPNIIANSIESIKPIPDGFYPPKIELANHDVQLLANQKTIELYGNPLPYIVETRLKKELEAIISNDFAVLYYIAHVLVKKSLSDGYLVGSRGSVGSSFVATMLNITEVNPLPPHYLCPKCKLSDFEIDISTFASGIDLPDKSCHNCSTQLKKEGFDIPFEVFMGFDGDKVPDIDLNFSGDYQPVAHKFAEEIFGKGRVFRAGTISTIAEKTAFGFVKKYLEDTNKTVSNAEIRRLVRGCTGVKKTTGQHPGGVIVIPETAEIFDFTPVQYPADDKDAQVVTTHFDYHALSSRLIKLDILGHDDPTVIKMLEGLTGINALEIPIDDKKTMSIFSSTESLGISPEALGCSIGTIGIPEFGTKFVRQMLLDTMPKTFSELVRISGLSHGTDVWLNNAQTLIKSNIALLSEVISTRDDIMVYLIYKGVNPSVAFDIMELVRKGKQLPQGLISTMKENKVPEWFIESCNKIKYMFPKAHAVAYVLMAFRIAYFKVYYPKAFYATYLTIKADDFDENIMLNDKFEVQRKISEIEGKGNSISTKEKNLLTVLGVILEMYLRGIKMEALDLYKSDAYKFLITDKGLRPPFNAYPGVGITAARSIVEARDQKPFFSIEDLVKRGKVSRPVIETLKKTGCLDSLSENNQLTMF